MKKYLINKIQNNHLKKFKRKGNQKYVSLDDAKLLCIIFDINDPDFRKLYMYISKFLKEHKIEFSLIILDLIIPKTKSKTEEVENENLEVLKDESNFCYITYKDLNWYGEANEIASLDHIYKQNFDILIDTTSGNNYTSNFIINEITSKLKIGASSNQSNFCDIIISKSIGDQIPL